MLPKIAFQILGTTKLHLGSQDPGSRKFSCPALEIHCQHGNIYRRTTILEVDGLTMQHILSDMLAAPVVEEGPKSLFTLNPI